MRSEKIKKIVSLMMMLCAVAIIYIFDRKTAFGIYSLGDLTAPTKFKSFSKAPEVFIMTWTTFIVIIIYGIKKKFNERKKDSN